MNPIESDADLFKSFQAIFKILSIQTQALEAIIKAALRRYDTGGDNQKALFQGYFKMAQAISKVTDAQQILADGQEGGEISALLKELSADFRKCALMATDGKLERV